MNERGPNYGVELIKTMPINSSGMMQAMPGKHDLAIGSNRVSCGYEALLGHYREAIELLRRASYELEADKWADESLVTEISDYLAKVTPHLKGEK